MPRFKLTIEYAGTRYSGWQIQKNARTVAGELERAIAAVTGVRSFELYGAGRTDAGVHALAQVAHLQIDTRIDAATLAWRVNDELPADINILDWSAHPSASTPATMRWRAATSIRSPDGAPRSRSRTSGGSAKICT